MAYKGKGKGRSSSGRRPSGGDGEKRTWNQRTSHDDIAEEKPRIRSRDDDAGDSKPAKRSGESSTSKERKPYEGRADKKSFAPREPRTEGESAGRRPYTRREDSGDAKPERRPYTKRGSDDGDRSEKRSYPARGDRETNERRPYVKREEAGGEKSVRKPYASRNEGETRERKPYTRRDDGERKPYTRREDSGEQRERKPYTRRDDGDTGERKPYARREDPTGTRERKPYARREEGETRERKPYAKRDDERGESQAPERRERKPFDRKKYEGPGEGKRSYVRKEGGYERKPLRKSSYDSRKSTANPSTKEIVYPDGTVKEEKLTRLNKYLANSGICSRREADELIKAGLVSVNGEIVTEMGVKIARTDVVKYNNTAIRKERKVYVLLNKPKDYITTTDDPGERKTVMSLVENAGRERIYPVGRLDRNTTGLLLITNDGELTKKLTHPSSNVKKIYHVELDKNLTTADLKKIAAGIELEDGFIKVDEINYDGDGLDKSQVGIAIHSGKNRIVRRIFESLGYEVTKLDRVIFAGLTKKDLPRGRWRNLSELEVNMLKMIAGTRS